MDHACCLCSFTAQANNYYAVAAAKHFFLPSEHLKISNTRNCSATTRSGNISSCRSGRIWSAIRFSTFAKAQGPKMAGIGLLREALNVIKQHPATWQSSIISNAIIFTAASPVLLAGLTIPGVAAAFLLGSISWRAYGSQGFLIVAIFFILGTLATKIKIRQKEAEGTAEKRKGRRGPYSVFGSGAAGLLCALASIYGIGGNALENIWLTGFVASFCTKLSDTVSSEIGKAYGKTTYLITNFKVVPRGTEGAVSVEGTLAGLISSILMAAAAFYMGQIDGVGVSICVVSSQLANVLESQIGALFQGKEGFKWLTNDVVNLINIVTGAAIAMVATTYLQDPGLSLGKAT